MIGPDIFSTVVVLDNPEQREAVEALIGKTCHHETKYSEFHRGFPLHFSTEDESECRTWLARARVAGFRAGIDVAMS